MVSALGQLGYPRILSSRLVDMLRQAPGPRSSKGNGEARPKEDTHPCQNRRKVQGFVGRVARKKNARHGWEVQKEIAVQSSETGTVSRCLAGTFASTADGRGA